MGQSPSIRGVEAGWAVSGGGVRNGTQVWGEEPGSGYEEKGVRFTAGRLQRRGHLQAGEDPDPRRLRGRKRGPTQPAGADRSVSPTPQQPLPEVQPPPAPQPGGAGPTPANGGTPCAIASPYVSHPQAVPGCTCPGVKGPRASC